MLTRETVQNAVNEYMGRNCELKFEVETERFVEAVVLNKKGKATKYRFYCHEVAGKLELELEGRCAS